ncbi:MAG: hypothetical protein C3F13_06600 [Anaerolineales bacterium]|nr:MAG: hypothetical protein C3F13_06600 [Anaerolineales bacterium]
MGQALYIAEERSTKDGPGFWDSTNGNFRGDPHGLLFPAYLSHALMNTGGELGYPNDYAVRIAFQTTFVYMLLAIIALSGVIKRPGIGSLAVIIFLQVPQLEYISYQNSRDAFRIIPLLLFATILVGFSTKKMQHQRINLPLLLPPFILVICAAMGHTLNILIVCFMIFAWGIYSVFMSIRWQSIFLIVGAVGIGLFFGSLRYVNAYIATGNLRGNTEKQTAIAGTALSEVYLEQSEAKLNGATTPLQQLFVIFQRDGFRLSVPGILSALLLLLLWSKKKDDEKIQIGAFYSLLLLSIVLPFFMLFKVNGIVLTEWFANNFRYSLHWYPFAAVCISVLIWYSYDTLEYLITSKQEASLSLPYPRYRSIFPKAYFVIIVLLLIISASKVVSSEEWRVKVTNDDTLIELLKPITEAKQLLPPGENLLIDTNRWNYYIDNTGIVLYTKPTYAILQGKTIVDLKDALKSLNIGAVVLTNSDIDNWWRNIPLYSILVDPDEAFILNQNNVQTSYIVDNTLVELNSKLLTNQGMNWVQSNFLGKEQYWTVPILNYISNILNINPSYVSSYLREGEQYESPYDPSVSFDFLTNIISAYKTTSNISTNIKRTSFIINELPKGILFEHPPSSVEYTITIPAYASFLFYYQLDPYTWNNGMGDGVQFDILLSDSNNTRHHLFSQFIDPKNFPEQRHWFTGSIDLSRWTGQTVSITFSTDCGPNNNCDYDWAGWGEPRIVQPVVYDFLKHFPDAQSELLFENPGKIDITNQTINNDSRPILYEHPSSRLVYSMTLPLKSVLKFGIGMASEVWDPAKGDGVEYNIYIRYPDNPNLVYRIFSKYIDPKNNPNDRIWFDEAVDLSQYGGQMVQIIYEALPGPAGNSDFDWGGWSQPVLIDETSSDTEKGLH